MNKVIKLFKALSIIISKPSVLNLILEKSDNFKKRVIKNYNLPQGLPQIDLKDIFPDFHETVFPYAFLDGSSSPVDLAVLKSLAKKFKVDDYLEIGTWRGESVANMASVVQNCFTLNLPDEQILKMSKSEKYVASHRVFSQNLPNVTHIASHSHTFDFESINKKFDMVFIDGDHHYEAVKKDTKIAFDIIKNNSSLIVWHDYASSPESVRWDVMNGILDGCPADKRNNLFHITNTLCAVYLSDNIYKTSWLKPYELPNKQFKVSIEMNKY